MFRGRLSVAGTICLIQATGSPKYQHVGQRGAAFTDCSNARRHWTVAGETFNHLKTAFDVVTNRQLAKGTQLSQYILYLLTFGTRLWRN